MDGHPLWAHNMKVRLYSPNAHSDAEEKTLLDNFIARFIEFYEKSIKSELTQDLQELTKYRFDKIGLA